MNKFHSIEKLILNELIARC